MSSLGKKCSDFSINIHLSDTYYHGISAIFGSALKEYLDPAIRQVLFRSSSKKQLPPFKRAGQFLFFSLFLFGCFCYTLLDEGFVANSSSLGLEKF